MAAVLGGLRGGPLTRRLLVVTPSHILEGGVERIVEALALGLPARGIDVVVGLARGLRFHDPDRYRRAYPSLRTVELDGTSGSRTGRIEGISRAVGAVDPDVVLVTRLFDAYPALAGLKARGSRVRLAVTIQAYESPYFGDLALFQEYVDLCVTSGRLIAAGAERSGLPRERIVNIPGGVAPGRHRVDRGAGEPLRLGYVGRLEQPQKRVLDLLGTLDALFRRGVPFTCAVVGGGPEAETLRVELAARPYAHAITLRGWLATDVLYTSVYPRLDVLLHFAAWEGVTIAPREAMAHGVVPVVSRFVGCRGEGVFLDGLRALTFPVGDVEGAAERVARLDADPALRERLAAAAASSQTGAYSHEGALDAWAAALHAVCRAPARAGDSPPLLRRPPGRLERVLPPAAAERLRRIAGRRFEHESAGAEWPHIGTGVPPALSEDLRALARDADREDDPRLLPFLPGRLFFP